MSQDDFFTHIVDGHEEQPAPTRRALRGDRRHDRDRRRRRLRRRLITALVLVLVLAGVTAVGYKALSVVRGARPTATTVSDYSGAGHGEVVVTIPDGSTGSDIAGILVDAGVVASRGAFTEAFAANSNASSIQAGTYTLHKEMSAANAVAMLLDPTSKSEHTLTIPEGATKAQVKERLMSVGGFTSQEVDDAFSDASAIGLPSAAGGDVEGWLAPSTYDVPESATATDVVKSMVATTLQRLSDAGVPEKDYETVLTEASIIEREVSSSKYYAMVARVIANRLADTAGETKGYLQMDSTVLYGLGRTGGIPSTAEINDDSNAYNTYKHSGLPPTPIGSPGAEAIAAAMSPAEGDWLYFVTVNLETGETLFASTLEEQKANTEKLTAYCKENAEVCSGGASASPTPTSGS